jgi:hypothetical protein
MTLPGKPALREVKISSKTSRNQSTSSSVVMRSTAR